MNPLLKSPMRKLLVLAVLAALPLAQCGCTMFVFCDGEGPLAREELGDWLGLQARPAPEPAKLAQLIGELRGIQQAGFAGRYSLPGDAASLSFRLFFLFDIPFTPAPGLVVKGRRNPWLAFVPGGQRGDWLYFDPDKPAKKQFYASQDQWDALLMWTDRTDAYDVASRERVAVRRTDELIGLGLGYIRVREVVPLDRHEVGGVHALADPKVDPAKVKYRVRDGTCLLLGIVGWGRVNHIRYLQLLWVPIPVGRAVP